MQFLCMEGKQMSLYTAIIHHLDPLIPGLGQERLSQYIWPWVSSMKPRGPRPGCNQRLQRYAKHFSGGDQPTDGIPDVYQAVIWPSLDERRSHPRARKWDADLPEAASQPGY